MPSVATKQNKSAEKPKNSVEKVKKTEKHKKTTQEDWKKAIKVDIDKDLEAFCLDNDDCRRFRYNAKTGIATVKVREENGRIYSANDLTTLINLLREKMNQKVIKCKNCKDKKIYTTNIFRHMEEYGCRPETPEKKEEKMVKCKICEEMGNSVYVPLSEIKNHCKKVHKDRKTPKTEKKKKVEKGTTKCVKCTICADYVPIDSIKEHIKEKHKDHRKCRFCKGHVWIHKDEMKKHNKEKGHSCAVEHTGKCKKASKDNLSKI